MSTTPVPDKKTFTKGEGITAIIVVLIFCLVFWQAITSVPKSDTSVPVVAQPVSTQNIVVTSQIVKAVGGKYRYFFDIRNEDNKPFSGEVGIELDKSNGEHVYDDSFSTNQPIQPGVGTSQFVETYTGPVSVHGSDGVQTFKYTVKSGGSVIKTGQGTISTKLESY
ncbi:MAG: hypothetical protein WAV21_01980 [Minisyncoccia bacterium]